MEARAFSDRKFRRHIVEQQMTQRVRIQPLIQLDHYSSLGRARLGWTYQNKANKIYNRLLEESPPKNLDVSMTNPLTIFLETAPVKDLIEIGLT